MNTSLPVRIMNGTANPNEVKAWANYANHEKFLQQLENKLRTPPPRIEQATPEELATRYAEWIKSTGRQQAFTFGGHHATRLAGRATWKLKELIGDTVKLVEISPRTYKVISS